MTILYAQGSAAREWIEVLDGDGPLFFARDYGEIMLRAVLELRTLSQAKGQLTIMRETGTTLHVLPDMVC